MWHLSACFLTLTAILLLVLLLQTNAKDYFVDLCGNFVAFTNPVDVGVHADNKMSVKESCAETASTST